MRKKKSEQLSPSEFLERIAPYKLMVRPAISGVSKIAEVVGVDPLDAADRESGEVAFGALLEQYGGQFDAKILVALWLAGVTIPRVVQGLSQRSARKALEAPKKAQLRPSEVALRAVEKEAAERGEISLGGVQ